MPYIIDGHNLIHRIPWIDIHDPEDEIQLIKLLQDFCRATGTRVEVFFDNAPPGVSRIQKHVRVTAHFVQQGKTADDAIRSRLVGLGRSARNWTVVTSDREIITASREAGAKVLSAEDFAERFTSSRVQQEHSQDSDVDVDLSQEDVEEWLNLFGRGEEET